MLYFEYFGGVGDNTAMQDFYLLRRRFKPSIKWTLLTLVSTAFLMGLGFWQLDRAEEKKELLSSAKKQALLLPSTWRQGMALPRLFQRLVLRGHYIPYTLLLDNQHADHQWGYHVLSPLALSQEQVVLVDRGWIKGDLRRRVLPVIETPTTSLSIQGQAYYPSSKGLVLGDVIEPHGASLAVIERVDTKLISNLLQKKVYPFIIRLDKRAPLGYVRDWPVVSMPPQRHVAYALQWFAMALVLIFIYIMLNLVPNEAEKNAEI